MHPLLPLLVCLPLAPAADPPRHVMIYHRPGRFAGWPANHGIWSWGDEVLVGFSAGTYKDLGPDRHAIDHDKPERPVEQLEFGRGDPQNPREKRTL